MMPQLNEHRNAERLVYLDRSAYRSWSSCESIFAVLDGSDVSLTFDAASRTVTRHQDGRCAVVGTDIFAVLEEALEADRDREDVYWIGYFGYACRTDLPTRPPAQSHTRESLPGTPDAVWMRAVRPRIVRHEHPRIPPPFALAESPGPPPETYVRAFDDVQNHLLQGNSYEVNLTFREPLMASAHPVDVYLKLRETNPAPYAAYLRHHDTSVMSSSPERYALITGDRIETRPIKGTTPRSIDPDLDAHEANRLATGPKFRAENLMIVDLLRNDLSMMCRPGSVRVPSLMHVESYQTVHQLVSTVTGDLEAGIGAVEALRRMFPPGSMTGAPKRRTMEIIADVEQTPRGVYAGAMGWIRPDGDADLAVVIRTLVGSKSVERQDSWVYELGTGGGITVQSTMLEEWAEASLKAERLKSALGIDQTEHLAAPVPFHAGDSSRPDVRTPSERTDSQQSRPLAGRR
jgi:para-aminobenzoate synthetase